MERREWCYIEKPKTFGMAPCKCGNADVEWSEFAKHLWCEKCQIDFIPEHAGIFDGPILVKTTMMMGISFDRVNLKTGQVEVFDPDSLEWNTLSHVVNGANARVGHTPPESD